MCGITGFIDFNKTSLQDTLIDMRETLVHRGPDDKGHELLDTPFADIGLGFRRLSIIELSELGHQPMLNENTGDVIIFNGEIYNYREIRKELEQLGYYFKSKSDTEVILKSYEQWGKRCVNKFIGMFAIALFDRRENKLVFFRDRAGVKPLCWYMKEGLFLFSSELKAFHKHPRFHKEIDFDALSLYFQHGYISAPYTIFKNTHKLLPGHILELDLKTQNITIEKYWDVTDIYNQPKSNISFDEAVEETEKILVSAFQYRMIADVPVGVFLSGGYDSSCVTALLQKNSSQKIKTFTIGFHEQSYNEAPHAKKVADYLGTDHHEYYCTFKEAMEIVPKLPEIYDEPFADSSAVPTTLVSKIARQHVTVALSADGGDEIFAGYPRLFHSMKMISKTNAVRSLTGSLIPATLNAFANEKRAVADTDRLDKMKEVLKQRDPIKVFDIINQTMTFSEIQRIIHAPLKWLHTPFNENNLLNSSNNTMNRILATEYKTYLPDDILQKVDRATMSVSLEGREPFLDQRIIEFVSSLPTHFKAQKNEGKVLLKKIVHKYIPQEIMQRPKMGFNIPLENWFKTDLKEMLLYYLDESRIQKQGIFNHQQVKTLVERYFQNRLENFERLWSILVFQMWYERWMEN